MSRKHTERPENPEHLERSMKIRFLTQDEKFKNTVISTLNSPDSWGVSVVEGEPADVRIGIAPKRSHYRHVNGKRVYFSVTFISENPRTILFDPYNYKYGVKRSGLSVEDYRTYVINHEFGHVLGKDHLRCKAGEQCPVMYQMTRGLKKGSIPTSVVTDRDRLARIYW
jgi:hypothetical protein